MIRSILSLLVFPPVFVARVCLDYVRVLERPPRAPSPPGARRRPVLHLPLSGGASALPRCAKMTKSPIFSMVTGGSSRGCALMGRNSPANPSAPHVHATAPTTHSTITASGTDLKELGFRVQS